MSARGKVLLGLIVSSATFAAFSKPVIAKKARATPAMIAKISLPSVVNSVRTPKFVSPPATNQMPMPSTRTRPAISTKVISMLSTTDSVMPMKLTSASRTMNSTATSSDGGTAQTCAKYAAKPVASEPAAAKLADSMHTVTRKVRKVLRNALLT